MEQLKVGVPRLSREPSNNLIPFDKGDIPSVFQKMYNTASSLAYKDGLLWISVKYKKDMIEQLPKQESAHKRRGEKEELPLHLESQLLDYVNNKREEYMQRMTKLLELYSSSKWGERTNDASVS
jgi:hypothetical protein